MKTNDHDVSWASNWHNLVNNQLQQELHAENAEDGFKNLLKNEVKAQTEILLFKDCFDNLIYRWFKLEESVSLISWKLGN